MRHYKLVKKIVVAEFNFWLIVTVNWALDGACVASCCTLVTRSSRAHAAAFTAAHFTQKNTAHPSGMRWLL